MDEQERILKELYASVLDGDEELARSAAEASLGAGLLPLETIDRGLTPAIREVGERFGRMELFLPEMVMSAKAMEAAVKVLEPHLAAGTASTKGRLVIGTVKGDIHDIGKNIAIALFKVNGFEVIDLGHDVAAAAFVDEALKHRAQIIGISGLLTTSLPMIREVIKILPGRWAARPVQGCDRGWAHEPGLCRPHRRRWLRRDRLRRRFALRTAARHARIACLCTRRKGIRDARPLL